MVTPKLLAVRYLERASGNWNREFENYFSNIVGGVISPILSNLFLHVFDKVFHRLDGPARWAGAKLVRYADDFVVLARYQGARLTQFIEWMLESRMGLELNREKTRVGDDTVWSASATTTPVHGVALNRADS